MEDVPIPPEQAVDPGMARDPVRTPMRWDAGPHAGFSSGRAVAAGGGGRRRRRPARRPALDAHPVPRGCSRCGATFAEGRLPHAARRRRRARLRARRAHRGRAQPDRRAAAAAGRRRGRAEHAPATAAPRRCAATRASFLHSEACSRPVRSCCSGRSSTASTPPTSRWRRRRSPPTPTSRAGRRRSATSSSVLEEQGLLAHPHTSAGRMPTDAGYRYFVDKPAAGAPRGQGRAAALAGAARGRRGDARDHGDAVAGHEPARDRLGAADRHHHDPPRRGAPAAAAGADGRRHHVDRRRVQARVHVRPGDRPGAGRLGRLVPERAARRA